MFTIGICGNSGSGKSTVCQILSRHKLPVLDCDRIYHTLTDNPSPCLDAIERRFGKEVVKDGKLDRKKLKTIVFHDKKALSELNFLTHRFVLEELDKMIDELKQNGRKACIIDAPLFFEAKLEDKCDVVCAVISSEDSQIERICRRDRISPEEARLRLNHQISSEELRLRADYVIENCGDIKCLEDSCMKFINFVNDTRSNGKVLL